MQWHEKNNHIMKGKKYNCNLCNKTYTCKNSLIRHIKTNHNSAASVCETNNNHKCDIPYNDGKSLKA